MEVWVNTNPKLSLVRYAEKYAAVCPFPVKEANTFKTCPAIKAVNDAVFEQCLTVGSFETTKQEQAKCLGFVQKTVAAIEKSNADVRNHVSGLERKGKRDADKASKAATAAQIEAVAKQAEEKAAVVRDALRKNAAEKPVSNIIEVVQDCSLLGWMETVNEVPDIAVLADEHYDEPFVTAPDCAVVKLHGSDSKIKKQMLWWATSHTDDKDFESKGRSQYPLQKKRGQNSLISSCKVWI